MDQTINIVGVLNLREACTADISHSKEPVPFYYEPVSSQGQSCRKLSSENLLQLPQEDCLLAEF